MPTSDTSFPILIFMSRSVSITQIVDALFAVNKPSERLRDAKSSERDAFVSAGLDNSNDFARGSFALRRDSSYPPIRALIVRKIRVCRNADDSFTAMANEVIDRDSRSKSIFGFNRIGGTKLNWPVDGHDRSASRG
jgi:hypothetical protein